METEDTGIEGAAGDAPAERGKRQIASYLVRVNVYGDEDNNLVAETNDAVENAIKTQLGYTYGRNNVSVTSERLDK